MFLAGTCTSAFFVAVWVSANIMPTLNLVCCACKHNRLMYTRTLFLHDTAACVQGLETQLCPQLATGGGVDRYKGWSQQVQGVKPTGTGGGANRYRGWSQQVQRVKLTGTGGGVDS